MTADRQYMYKINVHVYEDTGRQRSCFALGLGPPTEQLRGHLGCSCAEENREQYYSPVFHTEGGVPWDFPPLAQLSPLKLC